MTIWGHFTLAWDDGTKSASSVSFHFIKNMSWPLLSVAPINEKLILQFFRSKCGSELSYRLLYLPKIFSGSKPRSNPVGFLLSGAFFLADVDFSGGLPERFFRSSLPIKHQVKIGFLKFYSINIHSEMKTYHFSFHFPFWCVALRMH